MQGKVLGWLVCCCHVQSICIDSALPWLTADVDGGVEVTEGRLSTCNLSLNLLSHRGQPSHRSNQCPVGQDFGLVWLLLVGF